MELLRYIVPAAIILFYFYRLRTNPLVLVGIPLTLALGEAGFMRTWQFSMRVPLFPYALEWPDIVFGALGVAWVYVRQKRPEAQSLKWSVDLGVALFLLGLMFLYVPMAWLDDQALKLGVFWAVHKFVYFPLSIFVWLDLFRRVTREETDRLLETMAFVTVPFAGLYTLSSVGVPIFPDIIWSPTFIGSAVIVRDFLTFPIWTRFALAYFLTRPRQTVISLASIGILSSAIVLSYTRSWVIPALVLFGIAAFYIIAIRRQFTFAITRIASIAVVLAGVASALLMLFPENLTYAFDRVVEIQTQGFYSGNVLARTSVFDEINAYVLSADPIFGAGFGEQKGAEAAVLSQTYLVGDMMWTVILLVMGWIGITAFGILFAIFGLRAFWIMLDAHNEMRARFGAIFFMVISWDVIRVFASAEYLQLQQTSSALGFALIAIEARRLWAENPKTISGLPMFRGISLNWFTRDDEYWWLRRATLAGLVGWLVYQTVRAILR